MDLPIKDRNREKSKIRGTVDYSTHLNLAKYLKNSKQYKVFMH